MDRKRKIILILIAVFIFIIVFLVTYLINIYYKRISYLEQNITEQNIEDKNDIENSEMDDNEDVNTIWDNISTVKVNNANEYFSIKNCLNKYFNSIKNKEYTNLYNLIDKEYTYKNNINKDNINKYVSKYSIEDIIISQLYKMQKAEKSQYGIELYSINKASKEIAKIYIKINVDEINKTFSVIPNINTSNMSQLSLSAEGIDIEKNDVNNFEYVNATEASISRELYYFYNNIILYVPQEAYAYLNEEYKRLKFDNSYENFLKYVNRNRNKIESSVITTYSIENNKYILTNNFKNSYILEKNQSMDFNICLDSYTIKPDKFNNYSVEDKANYYVNEVINMINYKEYENLYSLINTTFKKNNFGTIEKFRNYISKNFYDNNYIVNSNIEQKGEYYTVKVEIKDNISSAANKKSVTFIIKINESDFEISFSIS